MKTTTRRLPVTKPLAARPRSADVFIIAEAGSNWKAASERASNRRALELIDAAAEAGADAVKFQTFRADGVYVPNAGASGYLSRRGMRQSIHDIFKYLTMPHAMIPGLARYAKKRGLEFMSSAFSPEDFAAIDPLVRRHKIASYEITYPRLIELAARSGKPLILSTGAAEYGDIEWAIGCFKRCGGRELTLMQCTARYPAPPESLHLRVIPELARRFGVSVGFSDHSTDPVTAPVAAVALGATVIEKHYTLSRRLSGPDHAFAIEPRELQAMVKAVRACSQALGSARKQVVPEEAELRLFAQRAVQAIAGIAKGEKFELGRNIQVLRPGRQRKGTHPQYLPQIEGRKARRAIRIGDGIQRGDYA
jgi:sialic acid synthase SpsE